MGQKEGETEEGRSTKIERWIRCEMGWEADMDAGWCICRKTEEGHEGRKIIGDTSLHHPTSSTSSFYPGPFV